MKKLLTAAVLILSFSHNTFAGSRSDGLVSMDALERLNKIEQMSSGINQLEVSQKRLQAELAKALESKNKEEISLNITYIGSALSLVSGGVMAYEGAKIFLFLINADFSIEANKRWIDRAGKKAIGAGAVASVAAVVAAGTYINVRINRADAQKIAKELPKLQVKITEAKLELSKEVKQLCKTETNHKLCY